MNTLELGQHLLATLPTSSKEFRSALRRQRRQRIYSARQQRRALRAAQRHNANAARELSSG